MIKSLRKARLFCITVILGITSIVLYRLFTPQPSDVINLGNYVTIHSLSFSPDDKYIVAASLRHEADGGPDGGFSLFFGAIQLYSVEAQRLKLYDTLESFHPVYNPDLDVAAFYTTDGTQIVVSDTHSKNVTFNASNLASTQAKPKPYISPEYVTSSDGYSARIVSSSNSSNNQVLVKTPRGSTLLKTHNTPFYLALDETNKKLAIAIGDGDVIIFDLVTEKTVAHISCRTKELYPNPDVIRSLVWLPQEKTKCKVLWVTNWEGRSILWDSCQHKVKADRMLSQSISCVTINHVGNAVAYGTKNGIVRVMSVKQLFAWISDD